MTSPRYYRGLPEWLWLALSVAAVLAIAVFAWRWSMGAATERGRLAAFEDAKQAAELVWPAERARWSRERDSLREVLVRRDSIASASASAARASIARLQTLLAAAPTTYYDTVLVLAATETANACTVATNDCDSVRAANTRLQVVKDSVHRAASLATVALSLQLVTSTDSLRRTQRALERAPTWKTTAGVGVVGTAFGVVLCLVLCK